MTRDLIKRIRNHLSEVRESHNLTIAQSGVDEVVDHFICMAEGYNGFLRWYSLQGQLAGIRYLGETGNPHALEYLRKLSEFTCVQEEVEVGDPRFPDGIFDIVLDDNVSFPNAKRNLREALDYRITVASEEYSLDLNEEEKAQKHEQVRAENKAYQTLKAAIAKLEAAL